MASRKSFFGEGDHKVPHTLLKIVAVIIIILVIFMIIRAVSAPATRPHLVPSALAAAKARGGVRAVKKEGGGFHIVDAAGNVLKTVAAVGEGMVDNMADDLGSAVGDVVGTTADVLTHPGREIKDFAKNAWHNTVHPIAHVKELAHDAANIITHPMSTVKHVITHPLSSLMSVGKKLISF